MDYKDALKDVVVTGTDLFNKEITGKIVGHIQSFKLVQVKYGEDRTKITTTRCEDIELYEN
jgi:hypothetical protein